MALRYAHQTPFLGIGLRRWIDVVNVVGRRGRSGHDPRRSLDVVHPKRGQRVAVFTRPHGGGAVVDDFAFCFRISFWTDVVRSWPHVDRAHVFESTRSRRIGGALVKGLVPLFIGVFGTFAFSWDSKTWARSTCGQDRTTSV